MTDITKQQAGKHLGKTTGFIDKYDAGLLVAVERIHNRTKYGIDEANLPFVGYDTWTAYEVSFLLENGFPMSCVAKISYSSDSVSIVESKSLKLYLNSLNMTKFCRNQTLALAKVQDLIAEDLSSLLDTEVSVFLHEDAENIEVFDTSSPLFEYEPFYKLTDLVNISEQEFTHFNESPDILEVDTNPENSRTLRVSTNLLRSNCRITSQPDWGDAYIHISGDKTPTAESLLQYIVSFRKEDHFHEEVCEMLYKRLLDTFEPEELMVTCLYTRRGGIDINPSRATHSNLLSRTLADVAIHTAKTLRQ